MNSRRSTTGNAFESSHASRFGQNLTRLDGHREQQRGYRAAGSGFSAHATPTRGRDSAAADRRSSRSRANCSTSRRSNRRTPESVRMACKRPDRSQSRTVSADTFSRRATSLVSSGEVAMSVSVFTLPMMPEANRKIRWTPA